MPSLLVHRLCRSASRAVRACDLELIVRPLPQKGSFEALRGEPLDSRTAGLRQAPSERPHPRGQGSAGLVRAQFPELTPMLSSEHPPGPFPPGCEKSRTTGRPKLHPRRHPLPHPRRPPRL